MMTKTQLFDQHKYDKLNYKLIYYIADPQKQEIKYYENVSDFIGDLENNYKPWFKFIIGYKKYNIYKEFIRGYKLNNLKNLKDIIYVVTYS